jgi:hypothetical protein
MGWVTGSIKKLARFARIQALNQVFFDFKSHYVNSVSYPQSTTSILITYGIGGALTVAIFPALIMLSSFLSGNLGIGLLVLVLGLFFFPLTLPFLFGYFVREMGFVIHGEEPNMIITDPFNEGRPGFDDYYAMSVDGLKFGFILFVCGGLIAGGSYTLLSILGVFLPLSDPFIGAFVEGWLVALSLFGFYVIPFLLARYAHTGTLGEAFTLSLDDSLDTLLDRQYAIGFLLGVALLVGTNLVISTLITTSVLLAVLLAFPTGFVLILQSMDFFAQGYRKAVDVTPNTVVPADSYAVPFRGGGVMSLRRDRSVLVLGETSAGRMEALELLLGQIGHGDTPFVVFDYKNKYREFYEDEDVIYISAKGSSHFWNIFREIESEDEFEEIGHLLFKGNEQQSRDPLFPQAARQLTVAALKYMYREHDHPTNEDFAQFLEASDADSMHEKLAEHADLRAAASSITSGAEKQAAGVFSHLQVTLGSILTGDFARNGTFSIREYMENPDGRKLILDFPIDQGERIKPVFRLFIDWAIRSALDDPESEAHFLLDEFQAIPELERIERLVSDGQAQGVYTILGLQSKSQLQTVYGEEETDSILSGLSQEILLRPGDEAGLDYIRNRTEHEHYKRLVQGPASVFDQAVTGREVLYNQVSTNEHSGISETELRQFETDEAIVLGQDGWQRGNLYQLAEIESLLEKHRDQGATTSEDATERSTTQRDGNTNASMSENATSESTQTSEGTPTSTGTNN